MLPLELVVRALAEGRVLCQAELFPALPPELVLHRMRAQIRLVRSDHCACHEREPNAVNKEDEDEHLPRA